MGRKMALCTDGDGLYDMCTNFIIIPPPQISLKLGRMYSEMIFLRGFIHCDPHSGNVLVRPGSDGQAQIVLLDHGLYKVRVAPN